MRNHIISLLFGSIILLGGCASTRTTEFNESSPVEYVKLNHIKTWQVDPIKRTCEHLYGYDGLLVINTGQYWGFYNPKTGLFAQTLHLAYNHSNNEKPSLHYSIKEGGLCKFDKRIPVNRVSASSSEVYVMDSFLYKQIKLRDALNNVYQYQGTNIDADLNGDLKFIAKTFDDTSTYQMYGSAGKVIARYQHPLTFESVAKMLKNKKWKKDKTIASRQIKHEEHIAFRNNQKSFIAKLNNIGRAVWKNRIVSNKELNIGDKVCDYNNYIGFVEQISSKNVKVMWKRKAIVNNTGVFFGAMPNSYASSDEKNQVNFQSTEVNDITWVTIDNISKCPVDFN